MRVRPGWFQSAVRIAVWLKRSDAPVPLLPGEFQSAVRIAVWLKPTALRPFACPLGVSIRRADRCLVEAPRRAERISIVVVSIRRADRCLVEV